MAIPKSFITQLLLYCDVEDIISSYVQISRAGRNKKALCPFHSEKTPSMVVYPDTQSFYCFGCGAGGDVISFIMRIENMDYVEAVHYLARRAGLTVPDDAEHDRTSRHKAKVLEINRETARFFHKCLKTPVGKAGYAYLKKRQITDEIITKYGLGFAPDSWNALRDHLRKKGFSYDDMEEARVVVKGKNNSVYDQFRNRVMFPIIDTRKNVIAFGGRVLDDSKPKYLNSPDTLVFKKSRNLFSLNFAKNSDSERLILAEGYMDVIAIHAAGFPNVVATLGTALTSEQARLLAKHAKEVIIAYDSDEAGQAATYRAKNLLSEVGLATKVLTLKDAKDPDEYIRKFGTKRFEILLDHASDMLKYELKKLKDSYDLEEPDQKTEYVRRGVGILSALNNQLEREVYAGIIAKETGVGIERILSEIEAARKRKRRAEQKKQWNEIQTNKKVTTDRINPEKSRHLRAALAEEGIISMILRNPDNMPDVLSKISVQDFATGFNRRVMESIINIYEKKQDVNLSDLTEQFIPEEHARIAAMLANTSEITQNRAVLEDYIETLQKYNASLQKKDIASMSPEEIKQHFSQYK